MNAKNLYYRPVLGLVAVWVLILGMADSCGTATPSTDIDIAVINPTSEVKRKTPVVWAGNATPIPELGDDNWHGLEPGGLVTTDSDGQALVDIQDCSYIYIFSNSEILLDKACDKDAYLGGNGGCAISGMSAYSHDCEDEIIIQTMSGEVISDGTQFALMYLKDKELTLLFVFSGVVNARPLGDTGGMNYGLMKIPADNIWFTIPGDQPTLGSLPARQAYNILDDPAIYTMVQKAILDIYPDYDLWQLDLADWGRFEKIPLPPILVEDMLAVVLRGEGEFLYDLEVQKTLLQAVAWKDIQSTFLKEQNLALQVKFPQQPVWMSTETNYDPDASKEWVNANLDEKSRSLTLLVPGDDSLLLELSYTIEKQLAESGFIIRRIEVKPGDMSGTRIELAKSGEAFFWLELHK
jgi:hypothetical protein